MRRCCECYAELSQEEAHYYGNRCEQCECDWFERIEAWRAGGEDVELDAMYSVPQQTSH